MPNSRQLEHLSFVLSFAREDLSFMRQILYPSILSELL